MEKIKTWLLEKNRFVSRLSETDISNLAVVSAVLGIALVSTSFYLGNTPHDDDSKIVQVVLLIAGFFCFVPIAFEEYKDKD